MPFVNGRELYEIPGVAADMDGFIQGRWTPIIPNPNEIGHHVGDVSVALFDVDENGSQNLFSMSTEECWFVKYGGLS